jgi:hypothetical protein
MLLFAAPATAGSVAATKLLAQVGPLTISLKTASGHRVKRLRAGRYRIVVRDRSRSRNFHLTGPAGGLNKKTGVRFVGVAVWTVRLRPGKYSYFSDTSPSGLSHSFVVR